MEETKQFKPIKMIGEYNPNNYYLKKYRIVCIGGIIIICFLFILNKIIFIHRRIHYDYLIVGSGLYGATFNYFAKKAGKKTLVIEKRNVTGGNLYCENIDGIWVHKYGPHIFHTNNKTIWDLVNSIVEFTPFQYQPVTKVKDKIYNSQFTMWNFNQIWGVITPRQAKSKIEEQQYKGEIYNLQDKGMTFIGKDLYKMFLKGYIQKEWRRDDKDLPPFIIPHLSTIYKYDTSYLNDTYQGIPVGCYNALFDKLLNDTEIHFNVDYLKNKDKYKNIADTIIYTGKIDEYFNYSMTPLDYRTLKWDIEIKDTDNYQGTSVIHYPDLDIPYIKSIEYKHFEPYNKDIQEMKKTIVGYEYVEKWNEDKEPAYAINDKRNNNIYLKYKEMAEKEKNVIFKGRLAEYKNYNMQEIFEDVINQFYSA